MPSAPSRPVPAWLRRWEDLHILVQIAIVAPVTVLLLWVVHIGLLNQPLWRGLSYGVFWGALFTAAIVGASRSERARRERRGRSRSAVDLDEVAARRRRSRSSR
ncbi:MAG TPA: hypothetical protein PKE32_01870 [Miltoncostaeaceae bacterium]|nr:hypothetical protein [Miltoncostaeaceae bacterium]